MCFAPERLTLFRNLNFQKWSDHEVLRHLNFQKCSEPGVFCTFWLRNVLLATMACTFSTLHVLKLVRSWRVLYILISTCASRHNGVQFFISHLARWLRTRRFSEPTFRPSGETNHWKKHNVSRLFYLFPRLHLLSSDSFFWFFLLILSSDSFSSLIFSDLVSSSLFFPLLLSSSLLSSPLLSSSLLFSSLTLFTSAFPSIHIVGSLTSKFPSVILYWGIWGTIAIHYLKFGDVGWCSVRLGLLGSCMLHSSQRPVSTRNHIPQVSLAKRHGPCRMDKSIVLDEIPMESAMTQIFFSYHCHLLCWLFAVSSAYVPHVASCWLWWWYSLIFQSVQSKR